MPTYAPLVEVFQNPDSVFIVETGIQAIANGSSGASGASVVSIDFAYGDASPKIIGAVLAGRTLRECSIVIRSLFNIPVSMSLGITGSVNLFIPTGIVVGDRINAFNANPEYRAIANTNVVLFLTVSGGVMSGSGTVYLEIV